MIHLEKPVITKNAGKKYRLLFVVSDYSPTDFNSSEVKEKYSSELSTLLQKTKCLDVVVVAGDLDAKVGSPNLSASHLLKSYEIPAQWTEISDFLLQLGLAECYF